MFFCGRNAFGDRWYLILFDLGHREKDADTVKCFFCVSKGSGAFDRNNYFYYFTEQFKLCLS